jgi:hypothetical protein
MLYSMFLKLLKGQTGGGYDVFLILVALFKCIMGRKHMSSQSVQATQFLLIALISAVDLYSSSNPCSGVLYVCEMLITI